MAMRIKDFTIGVQKEEGLPGGEAYAYAKMMEEIRASNPLATEKVIPLKYKVPGIALFIASMFTQTPGMDWVFLAAGFVFVIVGSFRKYERPLER